MKLSLSQIQNQAILGLAKSRERMHQALILTLIHIEKHGDRNALHNLIDGLKKDKANANVLSRISVWLTDFAGMKFDDDHKSPTYKSIIGWQGSDFIRSNFEQAKKTPYWNHKKPASVKTLPVFAGFDLDKNLSALIAQSKDMIEKEKAMLPDEKAKVHLEVSDVTFKALLELLDMIGLELVLNEQDDTQEAA